MPLYEILLPPFMTTKVVEDGRVELSEQEAEPSVRLGVLKLSDKAAPAKVAKEEKAKVPPA